MVLCIVCVFAAVFTEPVFLLVPENVQRQCPVKNAGALFMPDCKFNACANSAVYESTKYIQISTWT